MTKRKPVEPAPGPLEDYAARFDDLFANRAQRQGFRRYVEGLLLPEERNKTLTALANTEPVVGAQHKKAQSLQWFLTESSWDPEEVNRRRVELMLEDPRIAPVESGALVIDETGDRKDGKASGSAHPRIASGWYEPSHAGRGSAGIRRAGRPRSPTLRRPPQALALPCLVS